MLISQMVSKHENQIKWMIDHDKLNFIDMVKTMARFRRYQREKGYAEGFTFCNTYHKLATKRYLP